MCDWKLIIVLSVMAWVVWAVALAAAESDRRYRQRKKYPKGRYDDWP